MIVVKQSLLDISLARLKDILLHRRLSPVGDPVPSALKHRGGEVRERLTRADCD